MYLHVYHVMVSMTTIVPFTINGNICLPFLLTRAIVFNQDLMADLKSELSKNLQRLILGLMMTPAEFDAKMMKKAMEVRLHIPPCSDENCFFRSVLSLKEQLDLLLFFKLWIYLFTDDQ